MNEDRGAPLLPPSRPTSPPSGGECDRAEGEREAREWVVRPLVRHEDLEDELLRLTDAGYEVVEFLPIHPADSMIMPGLVTLVCRLRPKETWPPGLDMKRLGVGRTL